MDEILRGLMASNHKTILKKTLITKLSTNPSKIDTEELTSIYKTAMAWIVYSDSEFEEEMGTVVIRAWSKQNQTVFREFFLQYCYTIDLDHFVGIDKTINFIHVCLRAMDDRRPFYGIVQNNAIALARDKAPLSSLAALSRLLVDIPECIPKADKMKGLCIMLIKCVNAESISRSDVNKQKDVEAISALLHYIWHNNITIAVIPSLKETFRTISSVDLKDPEPSIAIGALVQRVPVSIIKKITKDAAFDQAIPDLNMTAALTRMMEWLAWPGVKNIHLWINAFLKNLAAAKKYSILIQVTCESIIQVFEKLKYADVRESTLAVLRHMLLSFQHLPVAFHKIVGLVPDLVKAWREEGMDEHHEHLKQLAELMYCLMYQHAGYPELYQPLLDVFQNIPQSSEDSMKQMLDKSAWTSKATYSNDSELSAAKSDTGKTGLVNLGNTCYLNSIVQALYMTDGFSDDILYEETLASQKIRTELRKLFAFLKHSNRAAFEPKMFVEVARPPWFTLRAQQDCSELLKYLLDRLDEEDKTRPGVPKSNGTGSTGLNSKKNGLSVGTKTKSTNMKTQSVTEKFFCGESLTKIRCLNCNHESVRTEIFYDLPLAFPDSGDRKSMLGGDPNSARKPSSHSPETEGAEGSPSSSSNAVPKLVGPINWPPDKFTPSAIREMAVDEATRIVPTTRHESDENKEVHIEDMLEHYISPEVMEGDNKYNCENCLKLQNAEKTLEITRSPQVLILTLMRFAYDVKTRVRRKILTDVKYPQVLELPLKHVKDGKKRPADSDLSESSDAPDNKRSRQNTKCGTTETPQPSQKYTLSAVVFHSGSSSESGHYYCYARELKGGVEGNWNSFNDCHVTHSSYENFSRVMKNFNRDSAYVLFYKRNDNTADGAMGTLPHVRVLPNDLKDIVAADNMKFLKEQEAAAKRTQKRVSYSTENISYHRPEDSDDKDGPSPGCGGGGGFNTPINRFVC
ncbi:ubiquitin carboxyl-terminal hydrolase 38-like isoform X1 [Anneissia japonica]|uniref:ubiquitin carboxyl-terminal hydrolase 38-like isoform X1 n=1 Tax=Anneissia japonica TaxID=1529436 RepID=UPI0014255A8E|nr:ubiquitin carboxyl-terminal hydrolase 38-like isoform X1 [Anneissia japonica]XP_033106883.1 ubiquitin carboxyl-terminal hydrolase 38-like isoform X2 [Anneissia japonica]XP_033106884.1 ubiquitin carboxyl-terminal hydrolase 38-like isoform X1 [Anneissia japonica]